MIVHCGKAYYTASATPEEEVRFTTSLIQKLFRSSALDGSSKSARHRELDIRISPMRRGGGSSFRLLSVAQPRFLENGR